MVFANKDSCISFFPICMLLLFLALFSCIIIIILVRTFRTKLSRSGESRHFAWFLVLGKWSAFHHNCDVRCRLFIDAFYRVKEVSCFYFESLKYERMLDFVIYLYIDLDGHMVFVLYSVNMGYYVNEFLAVMFLR